MSLSFADPEASFGYAFATNKLAFYLEDDPCKELLRDTEYCAIAKLSQRGLGSNPLLHHLGPTVAIVRQPFDRSRGGFDSRE